MWESQREISGFRRTQKSRKEQISDFFQGEEKWDGIHTSKDIIPMNEQ